MSDSEEIRTFLQELRSETRVMSEAYRARRNWVRGLNVVTVVLPAMVAVVAGLIAGLERQPVVHWLWGIPTTGALSGLAAILVGVHGAPKCDEYQAECLRLDAEHDAISFSARSAMTLNGDRLLEARDRLTLRYDALKSGKKANVPDRYIKQAMARAGRPPAVSPPHPPGSG